MTTEKEPEVLQTEEAKENTPTEVQGPDLAAEIERLKAENAKLANDMKAQRNFGLRQRERDALLQGFSDRLEANEKAQMALIRSLQSGETDALPSELQAIQAETTKKSASARFTAQYEALWDELEDAIKDEDGSPIMDLHDAPELAGVRTDWTAAQKSGDVAGLTAALAKAHRVARQVERAKAQEAMKQAKEEAKRSRNAALEEAEVADLSVGPSAAVGGKKRYTVGEVDSMTPQELKEHIGELTEQWFPKKR